MSIPAHFDQSPKQGTEREPRRTLQLETRGETAGGAPAEVAIHNISATGLLLETATPLAEGEGIAIDLPHSGLTRAEVVWASGRLYGCAFAAPLSQAALSAAQLRSAVAEGVILAPAGGEASRRGPSGALGVRIQRLRKERGFTLSELARRLGVSKPTVWAWEQGKARPVESRFAPIAELLGVTVAELQAGDDDIALRDLIARSKLQIAAACGTSGDKIRISIEL